MILIIDTLPKNLSFTLKYIENELKIIDYIVIPKYENYFYENLITKYTIYKK